MSIENKVDEEITLQEFGDLLRAKRLEKGYRLEDVAQETQVSTTFLSYLENGENSPGLPKLHVICDHLGVDFDLAKKAVLNHKIEKLKRKFT